ncbi:4'-phosphopantetheinyl transferase family protein [Gilvibacter sediminis]|uniref:4'-phosphopantetheinyl transferase family protein n=1 Tax=Gilvibacter sediminis TaxID=379071 RepID=UPI00234FC960|nr:4'-phosphopantetheinyl transferase superfamily protein [Gilvibacter sediminis]MDC7998507.1 4'-phosphopantetheinyl transferase superfamily protein [Gilvibacter sediminis]
MIGNDVVDLSLSAFDSERRFWRYSQKVCSRIELNQFGQFESKQQSLWRFWSLKEAAFKAAVRLGYQGLFRPAKIQVELLDSVRAIIQFDQYRFKGKTHIELQQLWSDVILEDAEFKSIVSVQRRNTVSVSYKGRLPFVESDTGAKLPASISHHGSFFRLIHLSA